MSQTLNGVLYVDSFTPTDNPGEYTFENGVYNIQNDPNGELAFGLNTSYVLFVPVTDINTMTGISGKLNRYRFTSVTAIDTSLVSGTILYDQDLPEIGVPSNGSYCLVSQTTINKRLAVPPLDDIYSDLTKGSTVSAMLNDLVNILDKASGGGPSSQVNSPVTLLVTSRAQQVFTLPYDPVNLDLCVLIVNGVVYSYGLDKDFIVNGRVITWFNTSFDLDVSDSVVFR